MNTTYRIPQSILLLVSLLLQLCFGFFIPSIVAAGQLTNVSDTISDSTPSHGASHVVQYTSPSPLSVGTTVKIGFDPGTNNFSVASLNNGDISAVGFTPVTFCGAASDEMQIVVNNTANDRNVTFTVCPGDTVPAGTITITFANSKITNPAAEGSYIVRISGTQPNSGDARVAIINQAQLTASVDTSLTFSIYGVASSTTVNGDPVQTSTTTTAILIPFGTLQPGVPKMAAQRLTVGTNARNGFIVTIKENQNLTSSNGADIDLFKDGNANITPVAWAAPSATLGSENTYGHIGVTSEDADLNGGEFTGDKFAGNFGTTSRVIFSNSGAADALTPNVGSTTIGYKIQISSLQEAGNDYTNTLTYVCTPSF